MIEIVEVTMCIDKAIGRKAPSDVTAQRTEKLIRRAVVDPVAQRPKTAGIDAAGNDEDVTCAIESERGGTVARIGGRRHWQDVRNAVSPDNDSSVARDPVWNPNLRDDHTVVVHELTSVEVVPIV